MENKFLRYQAILDDYLKENRLRRIPSHRVASQRFDLSSNDYLGLRLSSGNLREDFIKKNNDSFTSSASRLLAANQNPYLALENYLESLYGRPAILFNSGYHANVGCISALNIPGTIFLPDRLIHASVIDGLNMAHAEFARWRHNDINHLRRLLEKYHDKYERIIVVAESIYSMDGDRAPLTEMVKLKEEFPSMMLYLDEAHAFGVFGERGLGCAEEDNLIYAPDIIIGTFGKAAASSGAFAITSPLLHSFLINNARSLIFSTAIPPVNVAWTLEMLKKITQMKEERRHLHIISEKFRNFISRITHSENPSSSQIIPLITGDAAKAVELAARLEEIGIDALPIRRPTVPPGGERIRFSLNAGISDEKLSIITKEIEDNLN